MSCYNCGMPGHFAGSCPVDAPPPAARWQNPARLPPHIQAQINAAGVDACRMALASRGTVDPCATETTT